MDQFVFPNPGTVGPAGPTGPTGPAGPAGTGEEFIHFPGAAPAVLRLTQDRMRDTVHLLDFIPVEEHAGILSNAADTDPTPYDCSDALEAAMAAISIETDNPNHYQGGPEVIFPYGTCYFDRTIEIKRTLTFTGHGIGGRTSYSSRLLFKAGITGITVNCRTGYRGDLDPPIWPIPSTEPDVSNLSPGGDSSVIQGLKLSSKSLGVRNPALNSRGEGFELDGGGAILWNENHHGWGHGIWLRARVSLRNCIIQYFPQHGIYMRAAAQLSNVNSPENRSIFGNVNNVYVEQVVCITNGGCGIYIDGPDINAGNFIGCDMGGNRLSALHESSLIGNVHIGPHADNNGLDALCSYAVTPGITQMARYYCRNVQYANGQALPWQPATAYSPGDLVVNNTRLYQCQTGGTSHPVAGPYLALQNQTDGTVVWDFVFNEDHPLGVLPRIPPIGHADSEVCWGFLANTGGPVGTIDAHTSYPLWPYTVTGGSTIKEYRYGYCYWFDQISSPAVLILPYAEGHQPASVIFSPSTVIGPIQVEDPLVLRAQSQNQVSPSARMTAGIGYTTIAPSIRVDAKLDASLNTRNFMTGINFGGGEALSMRVSLDTAGTNPDPTTAQPLAWKWDEATGSWMIIYANATIAQRFTTTHLGAAAATPITGGRASPLPGGNTTFQSGIWLGRHPATIRHLTNGDAIPTTGQWAAGDIVLNSAPLQGEPWGWRCILTGDFTTHVPNDPVFQSMRDMSSQQTITDIAFALTPGTSPYHTRHVGTMVGSVAATLNLPAALLMAQGLSYRITRTSTGAGTLNVGPGPLKALATNEWCEVTYDGSAYYLSAYGAL